MLRKTGVVMAAVALLLQGSVALGAEPASYDLLIRNGMIYDGSGATPYAGDVGIKGDRIVYAGPARPANAMKSGAAWGTRTHDPIITNDVLYQLS